MIDSESSFSSRQQARAVLTLLVCLLASGCGKFAQDLGEVTRLRAGLIKELHERDVGVNLGNGTVLTISFVNSPWNDKTSEERSQRAEQTIAFVKGHYASISRMREIWVVFLRAHTHLVFVYNYETIDSFAFDRNGSVLIESPDQLIDQYAGRTRPAAHYSEALRQTDIIIEHLKLEGDASFGMSVMVHFTVPGEATKLKRSLSAPEVVSFDFSSFSEKSMFPGEPPIAAVADGQIVFQTKDQFSTSKSPDTGTFSESLALHIPYKAFRRMVGGKKLTMLIGDRAYDFTGEQVEALHEMTKYVKE
jgi:hypothetical protein